MIENKGDSLHSSPHFPLAYGNEEETGLMVRFDREAGFEQPTHFAASLKEHIPAKLPYWSDGFHTFLGNGGLVYPGGSISRRHLRVDLTPEQAQTEYEEDRYDNIERTTPECSTPTELTAYIQAHELLIVEMAQNYARRTSAITELPTDIRIQRRVVDSQGNRKGCHDNFGVPNVKAKLADDYVAAPLMGYIATRSFITGAGYVSTTDSKKGPSLAHFAQKVGGLEGVEGHEYRGFMYRVETDYGDERLEIRSNDINISPWAIRARIGGIALMLAALDSPLKKQVNERMYDRYPIATANRANAAIFLPDGRLQQTLDLARALDMQEYLADIFVDKLPHFVDIPPEYLDIAKEIKQYCEDFRAVLAGYLPLEFLADRSDFAAKFSAILANREDDKKPFLSFESMRDDMMYDNITVTSTKGGATTVRKGFGYALRDAGSFKDTLREKDVQNAFYWPPAHTRAKLRADLIRKNDPIEVSWRHVAIVAEDRAIEIDLGNVNETTLSEIAKHAILSYSKQPY